MYCISVHNHNLCYLYRSGLLLAILISDLEDPENMIKQIIGICSRLISRYKLIVPQLGAIRDKLYKHKLAVDISRTLGAAATVAGTIMIFTPIAPIGIGKIHCQLMIDFEDGVWSMEYGTSSMEYHSNITTQKTKL